MVLWVKSPRVASSDCASNPMRVLISLTAPLRDYSLLRCLEIVVRDTPNLRETRLTLPTVSSHVFLIKIQLSFRTGELEHEMHGVNSSDLS